MKQIRTRLTYANVMSSLAVFLVLGGATAVAANQLGKNSVGTQQLKKNAVTTAKIKKNAVATAKIKKNAINTARLRKNAVSRGKIRNGAVDGSKIADGSVTGVEINAASTPFSQIVASLRVPGPVSFGAEAPTLVGNVTQPAGRTDQYLAGLDVTFAASCTAPRTAVALLLMNPANPAAPGPGDFAGIGIVEDKGAGAVTKRMEFSPYEVFGGMAAMAPTAATNRTFYVFPVEEGCAAGGGISGSNLGVDAIGTN